MNTPSPKDEGFSISQRVYLTVSWIDSVFESFEH